MGQQENQGKESHVARVKRAVNAHKKRRVVLERASGYRGQRSRLYRKAKEQVTHSLGYAYRDRRARKGDFRRLWIQRINAGARANGMTYNRFVQGLKAAATRSAWCACAGAADAGIDVQMVSGEVMAELAQTITPQGLLAVCDFVDVSLDSVTSGSPALVALLANVRDPGNAGTVLRTADAAGADAVIFADASVCLLY